MPSLTSITRRDLLTLLIVLFAAALVRFEGPIEFKHDESWLSVLAQDMARGETFPTTGILSSVGVPNPPTGVYLFALFYALVNDPYAVTLMVIGLNLMGVSLLWVFTHRYFGRTTALVAGLAYALNPFAVLYSRKIWAQDVHTPLLLLALLLGCYGWLEGKRWAQILCLPILFFAAQIHFAGWLILPVFLWLLWWGRRNVRPLPLLAGVFLALLTLVPYGLGLSKTLQEDPNRIQNALGRDSDQPTENALVISGEMASGIGAERQLVPVNSADLIDSVPAPTQLWALMAVLAVLGIGALTANPARRAWAVLPGLWALLPVAVFLPGWTPVFAHYFVHILPALSLLTAVGLVWLIQHAPGQPFSRSVLLVGFCAIALSQAIWWRGAMRYIQTNSPLAGFGIPLAARLPVRDALQPTQDVILINDAADFELDEEPAVWTALIAEPDRCLRATNGGGLWIEPSRPFSLLITPNAVEAAVRSQYSESDGQIFPVGGQTDAGVYTVVHEVEPTTPEIDVQAVEPILFNSQAQLTGYAIDDGERVWLRWHIPVTGGQNYQYFVHLLDASGERIAQQDLRFLEGRWWCAGDQVYTWNELAVPTEAAILRVGMYRLLPGGGFANADVINAAGQPTAPWADLPIN